MMLARRTWLTRSSASVAMASLMVAGCASLRPADPPKINIVGLERLIGEGFELRFAVKLRVQNPNPDELHFDGVALDLDVNGRPLASGVSNEKGSVPRFGETLLSIPVSVNALSTVRQMLGLAEGSLQGELPYSLRGRLGGGWAGGTRFSSEGVLKLPQ